MSAGYISLFTNSAYFSDADLQNALPDFQTQVSNEFNYYWGIWAYLDDSGGGTPIFIGDGLTSGGVLGYHSIDANYNPFAVVSADQCAQYGVPITGVISHELLEMLADQLTDTVNLYDNGDGTGFIVDQEVCDPCEMSLYYEAPNGNVVSDFVTPAWFVPGDPNPVDFLGAIAGPWQLASGGYVCYQDVTLSGLICVAGDKIQKAMAKAADSIKRIDNPQANVIRQIQLRGKRVQTRATAGEVTVVKRKDTPTGVRVGPTPPRPPAPPIEARQVPSVNLGRTRAQVAPARR